ncbi:unnamed protein product [Rhizophagus irregularis]|uniref:Uncharacterized protein n=1 Tax=Rhizophagus irregularis TaxID=588596 RepID=A0A915YWT9_9GLOM|nr:unnamed protein product [Rhizophagus irregularis]
MWEISSGYSPFIDYEHDDYELAMNIINALYTSKVYDIRIPDNIDDFNEQKINKISKISSIFKASNKSLSKVFETLNISSKNDIQNDHEKGTIQQMKEPVNDDDEIYNNSNLHSKD